VAADHITHAGGPQFGYSWSNRCISLTYGRRDLEVSQRTFARIGDVQSVTSQALSILESLGYDTVWCCTQVLYQGFGRICCLHVQRTRRSSMGRTIREGYDCDLIHWKSPASPVLLPQTYTVFKISFLISYIFFYSRISFITKFHSL
jgi:hypothetical protein